MSSAPKAEAGEATRRSQRAKKPSADVRAAARLKAERVASRSRRVGRLKAGYLQGLLAPPDAAAERDDFYKDLQSFYRRRWQVNLRAPRIAGVSLDLFELYSVVSKQGGWVKVTERDAWWDVAAQIGVQDSVAGADHALKLTYMRYLNRYEKYRLFGDSGDGEEEGDNSSSSRRSQRGSFLANLATADCPFYRSRADLPDSVRSAIGLPDLTPSPSLQYRRLIRSLQSGLPNELDFAVNVLTLLSHPGPKLIRLESAPQIVPLLLAHLGVFADGAESMRPLYEGWRTEDRLPFLRFWAAALKDDEEAKLLGPVPGLEKIRAAARTSELFAGGLAPSFDQTKPLPHRVHQIASILRNLSFEAPNRKPMAASPVLLKFLHLCIRSRFAPLQTAAFDILSNVAPELVLSSSALVLGSVAEGLASEDKLAIVRSLETLASLCGKEENEDGLIDFLTPERLRKVISYLTVKDIMLAVYVLEALYQVSELGATTADRIAAEPHAMAVLVDLATVEAVSFGPAGLAGMKVVEYGVPQASALPPGTRIVAQPVGSRAMAPPQGPPTIIRPAQPRPVHIISSALASHAAGAVPSPPPHSRAPMASSPVPAPAPSAAVPPIAIQSTLLAAALPGEGDEVDAERAAEIQNERAEELTITWLKTNLVVDPSATTSRGELYAAYVGEMHKVYMSLAVSASTLASLLKKHFPMTSSRRVEGGSRPNAWAIDGVRYVPARIPVAAVAPAPLAKALTAAPSTSAGPSTLVQQYPIVNSILSTPSGGTPKRTLPATVSATRGPVRILVVRKPNAEAAKATAPAAATSGPLPVAMEENSRDSARTGSPESLVSAPTTEEANSLSPATTSDNPQRNGAALALPPNCHLEVCAEPKEAKDLIDQGREHEARIVRIENTTGAGASGDQAAKGQVTGDKEEKKEEAMDTSVPLPALNGTHSPPPLPTPPPVPTSNGSSLSNGKGPNGVKPSALAVVSGEAKGQQPTPPATGAPPQRTPSPGEMNRNILNSQAGIAELLKTEEKAPTLSVAAVNGSVREEGSEASNDAAPALTTPPTTPVKTPAKASTRGRGRGRGSLGRSPVASPGASLASEDSLDGLPSTSAAPGTPGGTGTPGTPTGPKPKPKSHKKKKPHELIRTGEGRGGCSLEDLRQIAENQKAAAALLAAQQKAQAEAAAAAKRAAEVPPPLPPPEAKRPAPPLPAQAAAPAATAPPVGTPGPSGAAATTQASQGTGPAFRALTIPVPTNIKYQCEWSGCAREFERPNQVYLHCAKDHVNASSRACLWPHCDPKVPRHPWSLTTHLQDVHCSEGALRTAALRRYEMSVTGGESSIPAPRTPPPHPGYSKTAATDAVRRHALNFLPKELTEENEGPVTKSIRLTACLILRNLARYSGEGRRRLRRHEAQLSVLALSRLEASATLAQALAELHRPFEAAPTPNQ